MIARALLFLFCLTLSASAIIDLNENGVSDLWEKQFNADQLFITFDPQADPDGDGWSNEQEAVAGTDPFDANSPNGFVRPEIEHIPAVYLTPEEEGGPPILASPAIVFIRWPTLAGKKYTVLSSPDLTPTSWLPVGEPRVGSGSIITAYIPLTQPDSSIPEKLFLRVAVEDTDTDGDSLTDSEEHEIGSSRFLADTDDDGTDDGPAFSSGIHPAGDGGDSNGDGVPDNEIYSVEFEVQEEWKSLDWVGVEPLTGDLWQKRYLTWTESEEYVITDSPRYANISSGLYKYVGTLLDGGVLTENAESDYSEEGTTHDDWIAQHPIQLGQGESLEWEATVTTSSAPPITADEEYTTTTKTAPWKVKKAGNVVRSGTEVITITDRFKLTDGVTYPQLWTSHFKGRPWEEVELQEYGPPQISPSSMQYVTDPAAAAESIRESYRNGAFGVSGNISAAGGTHTYYDLCLGARLKSVRWRWVRFDPLDPFTRHPAAPPASIQKRFTFHVNRSETAGTVQPFTQTNSSDPQSAGIITIECNGAQGSSAWQELSLEPFNALGQEDPAALQSTTFMQWSRTDVRFENLPVEYLPFSETTVSADDHLSTIILSVGDTLGSPDGSIIEWEIASGNGGTLLETQTTVSDGLAAVSLNTSTLKGAVYRIKGRIKRFGPDGEDISASSAWSESALIRVTAGAPYTFGFTTSKSIYRSDGTDTSEITATIKDKYGNLVEDDTPVSWAVGQCPTPPFVSKDDFAVGGIAKAVLRAPLIPKDQVVVCSAGNQQDTVTVAVQSVSGSISGNLGLDIGTGQQSVISVSAQAANGTPVYWTTSNGEITAQSTVAGGASTATLSAANGRLGTVVVTATVGDRLFHTQGAFTSSTGLAIGADHPVLIAGATANGTHSPAFPHGISRSIPYYASTPVRIKGPANGLAHLTVQASLPLASWAFDQSQGNVTPSGDGLHGMTLSNASIDEIVMNGGVASLLLEGSGHGTIPDSGEFHFTDEFNASISIRPAQYSAATLATKNGSWRISQLADGRIQAEVTTGTGTHTATTATAVPLNQWTSLAVDFRFNRLQIKLNNVIAARVTTTGSIVSTTSSIQVGNGFHGNLDSLKLRAGANAGTSVNLTGLGAGDTVQLDANGEGSCTVTSTGLAAGDTSIRIFSKVNPEAETEVALVDPDVWDYTWDTVTSFVGGDPGTSAGTVSSIAGGFLVVGDIGSCTKNLWRMAGWSDKDPNYVELSLGGLGLLTTFAEVTVVGAPADAGVASVKTLSIRFGNNSQAKKFLTVFLEQIKTAIVRGDGFGWAEANFLQKMVSDIPVADAFKLFLHDDGLAKASIRATEKLGDNAEAFYQATRRAVADHGADAAKKFVQVFEGMGDEALDALKNAPAGELNAALDGLAKAAKKGIAPIALRRILDNPHLYGTQYMRTHLLKDLGELSEVSGLESAIKMLKINHRNVKGFRYEVEGAASLRRGGDVIESITERVSVVWDDIEEMGFGVMHGAKTDIDVITSTGGVRVFRQFKSTAASMKSPKKVAAWCEKARKARLNDAGDYTGIMFHLPPDEIPKIAKSVKALTGVRLTGKFIFEKLCG